MASRNLTKKFTELRTANKTAKPRSNSQDLDENDGSLLSVYINIIIIITLLLILILIFYLKNRKILAQVILKQ